MKKRYCDLLGINESASMQEIKTAYRRKAKLFHPDISKDPDANEKFILINEAYDFLVNAKTGRAFNQQKQSYSHPKKRQRTYNDWKNEEREKARERARKYAQMKYKEFKKSGIYKSAVALDVIGSHLLMFFILAIFVIVSIASFSDGMVSGLLVSGIVSGFLIYIWLNYVRQRVTVDLKALAEAFIHIAGTRTFRFLLMIAVNIYLLLKIGLNTLIPVSELLITFVAAMVIGHLFMRFAWGADHKTRRPFLVFVIIPSTINLFFLLNFLFSANPVTEEYHFTHEYQVDRGRKHVTTAIQLSNNAYKQYYGIRTFFDFSKTKNKSRIIYHFEDGLFGIRVLKNYELVDIRANYN